MKKEEFAQKMVGNYDIDTLMDTAIQGILEHWKQYPEGLNEDIENNQDILEGESIDDFNGQKFFQIPHMAICKEDLKDVGCVNEDVVDELSDEKMQQIANKMSDLLMDNFKEALEQVCEDVL